MGRELLSEAASLEPEVSEREEKKTHLIISVQKEFACRKWEDYMLKELANSCKTGSLK